MLAIACVLALCCAAMATSAAASDTERSVSVDEEPRAVAEAMALLDGMLFDAKVEEAADTAEVAAPALEAGNWIYGENQYSMQRPEATRTYFVYVPRSYVSSAAPGSAVNASLVLLLHGLTAFAQTFADWTGIKPYAEQFGFLLVYPQGIVGPRGTAWSVCLEPSRAKRSLAHSLT